MKRKSLVIAATILASTGSAPAALAQVQTYYHVGVWDAFSGRNEQGGAVCGIGTTMPADNRRLEIRFNIGGSDTSFSVTKPVWSIPDNTRITIVMQVGLSPPWIEQGTGHAHTIDWSMNGTQVPLYYPQFRAASSMTLTFPDGNEPPWTIPLAGSSAITATLDRCVRDLTRQVQAAGAAPPQGPAPGPTQPFSPAAAPPPANAPAPAPQPNGTQPFSPPH